MFITCIKLDPSKANSNHHKLLISTLSELRNSISRKGVGGLLDAVLLRGKHENLLMTVWDNRQSLERFVSSEQGVSFNMKIQTILRDQKAAYEEYRSTWRLRGES